MSLVVERQQGAGWQVALTQGRACGRQKTRGLERILAITIAPKHCHRRSTRPKQY